MEKLSFSAYKKYHDCPRLYKFHYIDNDRVGKETSALIVGSIIDSAVMAELSKTPFNLKEAIKNARKKDLEFYPDDLDFDLVSIETITRYAKALGWRGNDIKETLKTMLGAQKDLTENENKVLRAACWQSLEIKILAMLESFTKWIAPQIKEIHDVQLHLENDAMHGYLDFTATMQDGKKVLFDLKTSKRSYEADSVKKSPQLSLYAALHDYKYAGFIVLSKTLSKNKLATCSCGFSEEKSRKSKCPNCGKTLKTKINPTSYSQLIIDAVPDWNKLLTKAAMRETIDAINAGHFPRNLNACFWLYGRECPYVNKCWNPTEVK